MPELADIDGLKKLYGEAMDNLGRVQKFMDSGNPYGWKRAIKGANGDLMELNTVVALDGIIAVNKKVPLFEKGRLINHEIDFIWVLGDKEIFGQVKRVGYESVAEFERLAGTQFYRTLEVANKADAAVQYVFPEGKVAQEVVDWLRGQGIGVEFINDLELGKL